MRLVLVVEGRVLSAYAESHGRKPVDQGDFVIDFLLAKKQNLLNGFYCE